MKLLLKKDVGRLGLVGDVIEVSSGYARNYLLPHDLATEATQDNIRALAKDRAKSEERRRQAHEAMREHAARLNEVEVTIAAAANEDGVLYGSVGPREVAAALREEGHDVDTANIDMHDAIRQLDNVTVTVKFADDIKANVKVWVVRSQATPGPADEDEDE